MTLDIRTLILAVVIVTAVYGSGLFLYRTQQKTFPGFGFWIASFFVFSLGYLFLLTRGFVPLFFSVIMGNFFFAFGAILRLDGVCRFTRGTPLQRIYYSSLAIFLLLIVFFYSIFPDIVIRTFIIGVYAAFIALYISYTFIVTAPSSNKKFFYAAAALTGFLAISLIILPIFFRQPPGTEIFAMGNRYAIHYLIILAFEICWGSCMLMINSQRLEDELRQTENELRSSNMQLEKTIKEKITLSGLLPICSHCKKIRDDRGYWNQLESYIKTHSEADFSHSICPECARKHYPDLMSDD